MIFLRPFREGYDQYLGGHISTRLVILTRMKIKPIGITGLQSLLIFTFKIWGTRSIHIFKHHHTLSICSKPHRTRMCSILLFLHNLLPRDHHQKKFSQDFKHQLLSHCPYFHLLYSSQYLHPGHPRKICLYRAGEKAFHQTLRLTSFIKMFTIFKLCILLINFFQVTQEIRSVEEK